jgi:hypothetical protein
MRFCGRTPQNLTADPSGDPKLILRELIRTAEDVDAEAIIRVAKTAAPWGSTRSA